MTAYLLHPDNAATVLVGAMAVIFLPIAIAGLFCLRSILREPLHDPYADPANWGDQ